MAAKEKNSDNTILDIAEALQLSVATVSRALNNAAYVKAETKERVLEMAKKLGYRRNLMASGLRNHIGNRTKTIGLIVPDISKSFHAAVITIIQHELHKNGYNLIISQSSELLSLEKELAKTMFYSRVDALIVACTLETKSLNHFDVLVQNNIPLFFYDRIPNIPYDATVVKNDDVITGYFAIKQLESEGSKITSDTESSTTAIELFPQLIGNKVVEELLKKLNENRDVQILDLEEKTQIISSPLVRQISTQ
jgi:LacI family transcriptional regulator